MKKLVSILLLAFWVCSLPAKETQIVIFSTNDMHGSIRNFAKMASYIEQERARNPNILILSGGDLFSGNPVVDQYSEKGYPIIELMNRVGYHYEVLGNHEFDYGQPVLKERMNQARFEFLCANIKVDEQVARIKQPRPYATLRVGDTQVCILALIEVSKRENGPLLPATHPANLNGITFMDPLETALSYKHLRKECDLFLGLTHTGHSADIQIAQAMPELDVIIGGHSHTKVDSTLLVNGVLVTQAQDRVAYIGKTTLTLNDNRVTGKKFELIDVNALKDENPEIKRLTQEFYAQSDLDQVIANATAQFDGKDVLGSLMTDAVISVHHLDFAFQNSGGIRVKTLKKGGITKDYIYQLDPFGNKVMIYEMTPAEIRSLIMQSYQNASKHADLKPAGMTYVIHTHDGKATRVTLLDLNDKPLDENKRYKVGMNSYISSSYRFEHADPGKETSSPASDALIEYLKQQKSVSPQKPRTRVVEE